MILRLLKTLASVRVTLALILSLSLIFLLGLWVPQRSLVQGDLYVRWRTASPALVSVLEKLGLTDIYTAPLTLTLWVLFFLNLSLVMWQRASVIRNKLASDQSVPEYPAAGYPLKASLELFSVRSVDAATASLERNGYRIFGSPERFHAVKNRFSPLASLLFHLSFYLLLLGGVIGIYTKFTGLVDLAQGEAFNGELERYLASPRIPKLGTIPDARLFIEKVEPEVTAGIPTGIRVIISDPRGTRSIAEVNRPYRTGSTSFVIKDLGVAPLFVLRDQRGRELDGAFVKLNVLGGKQDVFIMGGLELTVRFFPDYVIKDGIEGTRSEEFKDPVFSIHVQQNKHFVARRTIRPGDTAIALNGYRLSLPEMRYWVRFLVVKEQGEGIVYAGFALAVIALIWRLVFYRRELIGNVVEDNGRRVLHLKGQAEFFQALFEDEFEKLKQRVRSENT